MEENQPKISTGEWVLLLLAAVMFDLITWIPFLGTAVNFFAIGIFWLIFFLKGTHLGIIKKILNFFVPGFIEFIPLINIFPAWTASIIVAYLIVKAEEKIGEERVEKSLKVVEKLGIEI